MIIGLLPETMGVEEIEQIADGCKDIGAEFIYFASCSEVLRFLQQGDHCLDYLIVGLRVPWVSAHELSKEIIDDLTKLSKGQEPPWFFLLYDEIRKRGFSLKIHVLSFTADLFTDRLNSLDCGVSTISSSTTWESLRELPEEVLS